MNPARLAGPLLWLLLSAPASASAIPEPAQAQDEAPSSLDVIEVTGSHIRSIDVETQHPVITLDRVAIERTGLSNVAEIAQLVVANGPTANRNINNGSNGEQLINLRNLGFNRTLVLLNGQRFVSDIGGAVDLTAIPLALVERIEVLLDGASAIYGSDAIAGVVNIITRNAYDGGELDAYYGQNDHDDGERRDYDLTFGRGGEHWHASGGVEWSRDDPIFAGDRAISAVPYFGLPPGADGSPTTPFTWLRLSSGGPALRLIDGASGASADDFRPVDGGRDRYNFAPLNYLQTPQQRRAVFVQGRYEFDGALAANFDVLYDERSSSEQLAPSVLHFNAFDVGAANGFAIPAENLYNPFGEPIVKADRRLVEAGPRLQQQTVATLRLHAGLDGLLGLLDREFQWGFDVVGTRARDRDGDGPYGDNTRLVLALGPSFRDGSGTPRCGTPAAPIEGCVPLDLFGPPGSITPQMLSYATAFETNRAQEDSRLFGAHLATDSIIALPAGPVAFAAGLEYRRESGADMPDALRASGNENGNGVTSQATRGGYSVGEAYLELDAPLLAERPFAHRLNLAIGTRFSHYSNFGNTTNTQAGLRWRPIEDLLVRANYAQGFRAPAISELFQGAQRSLAGANLGDPCDPFSDAYADAAARCAALGVPAGLDSSTQLGAVTSVGNPALQPETSRSRGLGIVYAPAWVEGLDLGIDWYDVRLREAIYDNGVQAIIDGCYLFNSDADCALITRDPADGTIAHVTDLPQNLAGGLETSGYDVALHWRHETGLGRLRLDASANHVLYLGEIGHPAAGDPLPDGSIAYGNEAGLNFGGFYSATWRWRAQTTLTWEHAGWSVAIGARYFSHLDESCDAVYVAAARARDPSLLSHCSSPDGTLQFGDTAVSKNRIPSVTFTDLDLAWDAPWRARISAGARNVLNRNPPVSYSVAANSFLPDYDVPGRFLYVSYRQRF